MRHTSLHRKLTLASILLGWIMFLMSGGLILEYMDAKSHGRPYALSPWFVQICQGAIASGLFVLGLGAAAELKKPSTKDEEEG